MTAGTKSGVAVELRGLTRTYGATKALDALDLSIEPGEFIALLGPSGCGKTTALRILAGLDEASSGTVWVDGRDVSRVPANKRGMGMDFQAYSLFPHLTALENVEFGLKVRGRARASRAAKAADMLELVGLSEHAGKYAAELSGGQQQRVALARALASRPALLFADEPTGNLDAANAAHVAELMFDLVAETGAALVLVTHDEALARRAGRTVRLRDGRVAQESAASA